MRNYEEILIANLKRQIVEKNVDQVNKLLISRELQTFLDPFETSV